jgi:diaminohydroxyphosphoribosylaminopyrimidine deaminase/5-amino-6-(5-phosphoribosylamino)uracil reductase
VKHKIKKVYISTIDTNPRVSGKGVEILEGAGIPVEQGVLEAEGLDLNKRFFTSNAKKRPYIILKWAETADGFVARSNFDSKWISNEFSRKLVHKWRAEEDAVLVGKNTANYDDPMLNVRDWAGKDPIRIVIDHELKLDRNLKLFDHQIPTICYNLLEDNEEEKLTFKKLEREKFMEQLVADLHTRKIQSLIVEGGTSTLQSFIEKGLWDEARVFTAPTCFGEGLRAPKLFNAEYDGNEEIKGDRLTYFRKNT